MDLDNDGHSDIISGSYSRQDSNMAGLFQVLYRNPDGTFRKAETLNGNDSEPLIIPRGDKEFTENICTRPFAVDWDDDGHLDLVVGNFVGTFYWFKGEGKGKFEAKPQQIKVGDEPLHVDGHHADPFVIDWDGDGDLDILSGSSKGGVQWAENVAGKGKMPELREFEDLIKPSRSEKYGEPLKEEELKGPGGSTRIWVADINGDGKLDVLVGDDVTLISPAEGLSEEEFKKKSEAWQKAFDEASEIVSSQTANASKRKKYQKILQKLYAERDEFIKEDMTGFVWLYLQK